MMEIRKAKWDENASYAPERRERVELERISQLRKGEFRVVERAQALLAVQVAIGWHGVLDMTQM